MKTTVTIAALLLAPLAVAACEAAAYDPTNCDYEQAQGVPAYPLDRETWVDYNADGVVIICMWLPEA